MYWEAARVTRPSANTETVWVTVTMSPRIAACLGVPRAPTRYPATIVLPWPGESAWRAPQPNAAASRNTISRPCVLPPARALANPSRARLVVTSPPERPGGAVTWPEPDLTVKLASRSLGGLDSRFWG